MNYYIKRTPLMTKFLVSLSTSVIFFPILLVLWNSSFSNTYDFIQTFWGYFLGHIPYSLFVAILWHILQKEPHLNKNRIGTITIACIFATLIYGLQIASNLAPEYIMIMYITTPIEILLYFYIEKLFIFISQKENLICKIANIVDTIIIFSIYAIVAQCFLSWIPNLNWEFLPLKIFWYIVGPYECIFDVFIPRFVGINISPIFSIAILYFAKKQLATYFEDILIELGRK